MDLSRRKLDQVQENLRKVDAWKDALESLYYTSIATEISIEHLMRPGNQTGLDFTKIIAQMRDFKDYVDSEMKLVRVFGLHTRRASKDYEALKNKTEPRMVVEVDRLKLLILEYCSNMKDRISTAAEACRGFHHFCEVLLDCLVAQYSKLLI